MGQLEVTICDLKFSRRQTICSSRYYYYEKSGFAITPEIGWKINGAGCAF